MQLTVKQLPIHLKKGPLAPAYLLCGDAPLLIQEARDAIREASRQADYVQNKVFFVEPGFNWYDFQHELDNFSLFSDKSLFEIRNPQAKFNDHAKNILLNYLDTPPSDKRLLIITEKLTAAQQRTQWYKAIDKSGVIIRIWPISLRELPSWIHERFKHANLHADHDSIRLLAELTEGNLLATKQAIEKLRLLYPNETISVEKITRVVGNNARYNVFDLTHQILFGSPTRVKKIINGLRDTGVEATLVLWVLVRELRTLYTLAHEHQNGIPLPTILANQWQSRKIIVQRALLRLSTQQIGSFLQQATRIDGVIKGVYTGKPWEELERFSLSVAGATVL